MTTDLLFLVWYILGEAIHRSGVNVKWDGLQKKSFIKVSVVTFTHASLFASLLFLITYAPTIQQAVRMVLVLIHQGNKCCVDIKLCLIFSPFNSIPESYLFHFLGSNKYTLLLLLAIIVLGSENVFLEFYFHRKNVK